MQENGVIIYINLALVFMLWELLWSKVFQTPAHLGHGLRYYKYRQKVCAALFYDGFSS